MTLSTSAVAVCCCRDSAQFAEEPCVLDRDHGLRGEVLYQLDLLVGERPDLLAIDRDRADQLLVLEHGNQQQRAGAADVGGGATLPISLNVGLLCPDIGNVDGLSGFSEPAQGGAGSW